MSGSGKVSSLGIQPFYEYLVMPKLAASPPVFARDESIVALVENIPSNHIIKHGRRGEGNYSPLFYRLEIKNNSVTVRVDWPSDYPTSQVSYASASLYSTLSGMVTVPCIGLLRMRIIQTTTPGLVLEHIQNAPFVDPSMHPVDIYTDYPDNLENEKSATDNMMHEGFCIALKYMTLYGIISHDATVSVGINEHLAQLDVSTNDFFAGLVRVDTQGPLSMGQAWNMRTMMTYLKNHSNPTINNMLYDFYEYAAQKNVYDDRNNRAKLVAQIEKYPPLNSYWFLYMAVSKALRMKALEEMMVLWGFSQGSSNALGGQNYSKLGAKVHRLLEVCAARTGWASYPLSAEETENATHAAYNTAVGGNSLSFNTIK